MSTQKIILFDEVCPLCRVYTGAFVLCGLLGRDGRMGFPEGIRTWGHQVDPDRARQEIPLVDAAGGATLYGVEALLWILGQRFPRLVGIARVRWVRRLLETAYHFISSNRRVIVGTTEATRPEEGAPAFDRRQRLIWLGLAGGICLLILLAFREIWLPTALMPGQFWLIAVTLTAIVKLRTWDAWGRLAGHAAAGVFLWTAAGLLPAGPARWAAAIPVLALLLLDARRRTRRPV